MVPTVSADEVLALVREGKKVVFVDAREPEEWKEEHIPGAINLTLRQLGDLDPKTLGDPDLVIAYCLKDFRGFEVAKALQRSGVDSAGILSELGINGWKKRGLPTVTLGSGESTGMDRLRVCASDSSKCGAKP
ncbi:MAG: rhodanese-like domain-containing protein [Panacagrimonas sp.]